ncbi:Alg9-like mannosyltransferase family-domain-containing protein [Polychytrium aggregatum]|uniref:Alg9-like mannosyltransferase family-domain-containing protein n=1 Tax=Polychytrium aggregatum TaxID=110093 RepID=UPI0022FE326C|nr:Alg9-like mannosyltransferase family-domain-containing protein [Polychytrium aggregatum]KAI9199514.1 Alg9-like mannosyltransferase family-domain-containing protein [Polychytrium aggregatum]
MPKKAVPAKSSESSPLSAHISSEKTRISIPLKPTLFLKIFLAAFAFRAYNAVSVKTFFSPDEYWQSLEWAHQIRSFAHPFIFALGYQALKSLGLDNTELVILTPKLIQAAFSAMTDTYTFMLTWKLFGKDAASWALAASFMSWFNYFCGVRTFSNCMETTFTVVALYYWPWTRIKLTRSTCVCRDLWIALAVAAAGCIVRPTNAILWIFMGTHLLWQNRKNSLSILGKVAVVATVAIVFAVVIDKAFYKSLTFTPFNFFKVNIVHNISIFYGGHPWHWYWTQGYPVVALTFIPAMILGIRKTRLRLPLFLMLWTIGGYSLLAHKEFRFILPILPITLAYSGVQLASLAKAVKLDREQAVEQPVSWKMKLVRRLDLYIWLAFLAITNFGAAYYFSNVHQRGVIDVMTWLRTTIRNQPVSVDGILFLMPCHSTPYYSHIHRDIEMRFLSCEPPLGVVDRGSYIPEDDLFYSQPHQFIQQYFSPSFGNKTLHTVAAAGEDTEPIAVPGQPYKIQRYSWPSHIVIFQTLEALMRDLILGSDYRVCARFFNSHFHDDDRRKGDVIVYCRS